MTISLAVVVEEAKVKTKKRRKAANLMPRKKKRMSSLRSWSSRTKTKKKK
jgi:hypothetical protein